jgi:TRAP-type C4-dicarboxylate transport system permease small subunit
MEPLLTVATLLGKVNGALLAVGRWIGVVAVAVMVVVIIVQIFFRYVLNNALPWPDEAARFCMLWMTGLMAPTAFRSGGFVAIDVIDTFVTARIMHVLQLALLTVSLVVLVVGVQIGWKEVTGLGGRFATASLYLPTSLGFDSWYRIPRSWMMTSLLVGIALLILVNLELILHRVVRLFGGGDRLPVLATQTVSGAE